jgi:uncharacterized coiled-coil protein SlyX
MNQTEEHIKRITDLEIQLTYQEDLLSKLNEVIIEQARLVSNYGQRLFALEAKLKALGAGSVEVGTIEDNKPPHY